MGYYYDFEVSGIFVPAEKVPAMLDALVPIAKEAIKSKKINALSRAEASANDERYHNSFRQEARANTLSLRTQLEELPARTLSRDEILLHLSWKLNFDESGNLINLYHGESKRTDFEELEPMAPFVQDGGYVEVQGDDGDLFRKVFRGGKMKHVQAVILFPEED